MTDGLWNVQKAIYSLLTNGSPTIAGGRVFDFVPQTEEYPYVRIGDVIAEEDDVDNSSGTNETLTIDVYSRTRGKEEALEIMQEIKDLVHKQVITVTGRTALAWWAGSLTRQDSDGVTTHGIIRIRIVSRAAT